MSKKATRSRVFTVVIAFLVVLATSPGDQALASEGVSSQSPSEDDAVEVSQANSVGVSPVSNAAGESVTAIDTLSLEGGTSAVSDELQADGTADDASGGSDVGVKDLSSSSVTDSISGEVATADTTTATGEISSRSEETKLSTPHVRYVAHVSNIGWQGSEATDGSLAGTTGRGLAVEALKIALADDAAGSYGGGGIRYMAHVANIGWPSDGAWTSDGGIVGTTGRSLAIEAVRIELTGDVAESYDVWYRVHVQNIGWMAWTKDGGVAGTVGRSLQVEALEVTLVPKGAAAPGASSGREGGQPQTAEPSIWYRSHVQDIGWQGWLSDGEVSGTQGMSLRLEATEVKLADVEGQVLLKGHVQDVGWDSEWQAGTAGSTGKGRRLEAVRAKLSEGSEAAERFDLYYRVHVEDFGWLDWAKNGEMAGTQGFSRRIEAIQFQLVEKGGSAPGSTARPCVRPSSIIYQAHVQDIGWQLEVKDGQVAGTTGRSKRVEALRVSLANDGLSGGVEVSAHVQDIGWQSYVASGQIAGTTGQSKRVEAIRVRLTGEVANYYDVWYRCHCQNYGWLGWAKNGADAGTSSMSLRVEAIQIQLVTKGSAAPGSTSRSYLKGDGLRSAPSGRSVQCFGGLAVSSGTLTSINSALSAFTQRGYDVGFVAMNVSTGEGVCYNADTVFYSASTVKGPYVASVCFSDPSALDTRHSQIERILYYSSNDDYRNLHNSYGTGPMYSWCASAGVPTSIAGGLYTYYSPRQLAMLWLQNYSFFTGSSVGRRLQTLYQNPQISPIHTTLGSRYTTQSKAGWIGESGYNAANDAGIVYGSKGAYVVAIESNAPAQLWLLNGLASAIDAAQSQA